MFNLFNQVCILFSLNGRLVADRFTPYECQVGVTLSSEFFFIVIRDSGSPTCTLFSPTWFTVIGVWYFSCLTSNIKVFTRVCCWFKIAPSVASCMGDAIVKKNPQKPDVSRDLACLLSLVDLLLNPKIIDCKRAWSKCEIQKWMHKECLT